MNKMIFFLHFVTKRTKLFPLFMNQGFEVRQYPLGHEWPLQTGWLWYVQGGNQWWTNYGNILWNPWLHRPRGEQNHVRSRHSWRQIISHLGNPHRLSEFHQNFGILTKQTNMSVPCNWTCILSVVELCHAMNPLDRKHNGLVTRVTSLDIKHAWVETVFAWMSQETLPILLSTIADMNMS